MLCFFIPLVQLRLIAFPYCDDACLLPVDLKPEARLTRDTMVWLSPRAGQGSAGAGLSVMDCHPLQL
jgi:hypothetical protein